VRVDRLKAKEAYARQGHMPWRRLPLEVAAVDAGRAFPPTVRVATARRVSESVGGLKLLSADGVAWVLMGQHDNKARVRVLVSGRRYAEINLVRPWGSWWYVVSARRIGVPKSRIVLVHPDGSREFLPGPLILKSGHAYVRLRDLERVSIMSEWNRAKRVAKVYIPQSDNLWLLRAGQNMLEGCIPRFFRPGTPSRPVMRHGELYVPAATIAQIFGTFTPAWDYRSGTLELYVQPFR
jgi:hypothetical protein